MGWIGTHVLIIIAYIATATVVLVEKRLEQEKGYKTYYTDKDDFPAKKLAFAVVSLIAAFFLILMILFACMTLKKSDYDDYSVETKDEGVSRRKILES